MIEMFTHDGRLLRYLSTLASFFSIPGSQSGSSYVEALTFGVLTFREEKNLKEVIIVGLQ